jgi:catechol 2,3-dioxygenase-like lactoylglutathione lyase family enzyme
MKNTAATPINRKAPTLPGSPNMLNHLAYVTHDVEKTVDFYENVLGMPMVSTVVGDNVPSTGDDFPYFHVFFKLGDGSTLAFFEAPGLPEAAPKGHPAYDIFDHVAFEATSREQVDAWYEWLVHNGIQVVGPTDHGIIYSIYFRDPVNDIRLEITVPLSPDWNNQTDKAKRDLKGWLDTKRTAAEHNQPVEEALLKYIQAENEHGRPPA